MKIISTGAGYKIYDNSLKTYDALPAQAYSVAFDQQTGFSLVEYADIKVSEKTYGVHTEKVTKVANGFERSKRNLGVILSGDKGIGKSLFAKMLAEEGIHRGFPIIVIEHYIPGIADFINSIEQEVYVLFDEFDKTFGGKREDRDSIGDPQTEMLTLFDGIAQGKKLFIITCNNLSNLNDYLVNRPGRFHYHFRFDYPDADSITEYLSDKGIAKEEIDKVIAFASKVKLNYDCLRSIAFELETGDTFETAIADLNIINTQGEVYSIIAYFDDGSRVKTRERLDLFSGDSEVNVDFNFPQKYWDLGSLTFVPTDAFYDVSLGGYRITAEDASWDYDYDVQHPDEDSSDGYKVACAEWNKKKFQFAIIKHVYDKNIHYAV
jgi:hypothetical protein